MSAYDFLSHFFDNTSCVPSIIALSGNATLSTTNLNKITQSFTLSDSSAIGSYDSKLCCLRCCAVGVVLVPLLLSAPLGVAVGCWRWFVDCCCCFVGVILFALNNSCYRCKAKRRIYTQQCHSNRASYH